MIQYLLIQNLFFTLKKIAPDKWKHFFVGIPLGIVLEFISFYFFRYTCFLQQQQVL